MHLHNFFIDSSEINGKKGQSIVHFVELGLIFESFQGGWVVVGIHLAKVKCTFVVRCQVYDNFSQGFRMCN
jgi:hypothetical protein